LFIKVIDASKKLFSLNPAFINGKYSISIILDKSFEGGISVGNQILPINGIDYSGVSSVCIIIGKPSLFNSENKLIIIVKIKNGEEAEIESKFL
jgi:hypothetical protein